MIINKELAMATDLALTKKPAAIAPTILDILRADIMRPENRYVNTPLIRLITSGKLPRESLKDYAILRWAFQAHHDATIY